MSFRANSNLLLLVQREKKSFFFLEEGFSFGLSHHHGNRRISSNASHFNLALLCSKQAKTRNELVATACHLLIVVRLLFRFESSPLCSPLWVTNSNPRPQETSHKTPRTIKAFQNLACQTARQAITITPRKQQLKRLRQ